MRFWTVTRRPNSAGRSLKGMPVRARYKRASKTLRSGRLPGLALLGAFAAYDNGERTPWPGIIAGAVIGLFFGLVFGGALPRRWADAIFGERE